MNIIITISKVLFLLGFLILIHESAHFIVAKICKVRVNQFSLGFGPKIIGIQGKETFYTIRIIPLGGYVSMEGEEKSSDLKESFNKASIPKKIAIVSAGAIINILFGLILYFILALLVYMNIGDAIKSVIHFSYSLMESIKMLFTGNFSINDLTGPVGISKIVSQTSGIKEYIYIMSIISVSLGITNLLPIPALDGGKIILLIIEAIRKKAIKEETEAKIQLIGFILLITLAIFVTYNDIIRIIN